VLQAIQLLPHRQRHVLILAAIGVRKTVIGGLLGIEDGAVRASLHYARKTVAARIGESTRSVDAAVRSSVGITKLLSMLPTHPWQVDSLALIRAQEGQAKWLEAFEKIKNGEMSATVDKCIIVRHKPERHTLRYGDEAVIRCLSEISTILRYARHGISDKVGIAAQCGSLQLRDFRPDRNNQRFTLRRWLDIISGRRPHWLGPDTSMLVAIESDDDLESRHITNTARYTWIDDIPETSRYLCPTPYWPPSPPSSFTLVAKGNIQLISWYRWSQALEWILDPIYVASTCWEIRTE